MFRRSVAIRLMMIAHLSRPEAGVGLDLGRRAKVKTVVLFDHRPGEADAAVVGSGPNGLAAALTLARAGLSVAVYEGAQSAGGGCRTEALTLPGFAHDVCSTVHPLLAASPFFAGANLHGLKLLRPQIAFAHPLDGGEAVALASSVEQTAAALRDDGPRYQRLLGPLVHASPQILPSLLSPMLKLPEHPLALARFGLRGLWPASMLAKLFRTERAKALLAGLAAHSMQPLSAAGTGAFALMLGMLGHTVGWPLVQGGSARIVDALTSAIAANGGRVHTGRWIGDLRELGSSRLKLLDLTPRQLSSIAGSQLNARQLRALRRFKYGPGVCKVDWALSGPVPWQAEVCRESPTLHIGGSLQEIAFSEAQVAAGRHAPQPFCIAVQPCVIDASRAPAGQHAFYAYCHVPSGSTLDVSDQISAQIERFAPGFRDLVLAKHVLTAAQIEANNPNCIGGDINSGAASLWQTLFRPRLSLHPYDTPLLSVYLCSSSTPPGGGVHGMCGLGAAQAALRDLR
jgi:phytoene dehydrogenase-like protein